MAYSDNGKDNKIWKNQIYKRYSHLGQKNFLTYAYNSSKEFYKNSKQEIKEGMNSQAIRKQLSRHFMIIQQTLNSKNQQRFEYKAYKGKTKIRKTV